MKCKHLDSCGECSGETFSNGATLGFILALAITWIPYFFYRAAFAEGRAVGRAEVAPVRSGR